jgi:hypothetical protein
MSGDGGVGAQISVDVQLGGNLPWQRFGCFGPAGFDAYGRLRLLLSRDPRGPH